MSSLHYIRGSKYFNVEASQLQYVTGQRLSFVPGLMILHHVWKPYSFTFTQKTIIRKLSFHYRKFRRMYLRVNIETSFFFNNKQYKAYWQIPGYTKHIF